MPSWSCLTPFSKPYRFIQKVSLLFSTPPTKMIQYLDALITQRIVQLDIRICSYSPGAPLPCWQCCSCRHTTCSGITQPLKFVPKVSIIVL